MASLFRDEFKYNFYNMKQGINGLNTFKNFLNKKAMLMWKQYKITLLTLKTSYFQHCTCWFLVVPTDTLASNNCRHYYF